MRDTVSTPAETSKALHTAVEGLNGALREFGLNPEASVSEVMRHLRRLLVDAQVAAQAGNKGDLTTLVLALTDVRDRGQVISKTADATIEHLLTEHPELGPRYREAVRRAGRDNGAAGGCLAA